MSVALNETINVRLRPGEWKTGMVIEIDDDRMQISMNMPGAPKTQRLISKEGVTWKKQ